MGYIILLIILILLNGFFSMCEMAYVTLNDAKIDLMVKEGNIKARKIKRMLENPSKFLSTIQIGITLAGFLSSAFASEAFASNLAPILNKWISVISIETWNTISIILITIILSYFTLIFGELVPKRLAMKYDEKIAFATIGVIKFVSVVTSPFVKLLSVSTDFVSKLFGVNSTEEEIVTEEEIKMMVDVGKQKGTIETNESEMIKNVFEFNDIEASEVMIPRNEVLALDMNLTIAKAMDKFGTDIQFSRLPLYEGTIDNIKGMVHIKDILLSSKSRNMKLKSIMRETYFVPETKKVDELFDEMRKNRIQMAVVLDEYGGTAGIVTIEDILEEIVGEIYDEYDEIENKYEKIDDNTYWLDGSLTIYETERILDVELPAGDYDTISGYLLEKLGRIPRENEKPIVKTNDVNYMISKIKDKRIVRIKALKLEKEQELEEE